MLYGSIEAGGTKFVCAIGNEKLEILERVSYPTTTPAETMALVIDFLINIKKNSFPLELDHLDQSIFVQLLKHMVLLRLHRN